MSDKIRPNEVSEILFQQLQQINDGQDFDEIGTVLTVGDGVARVYVVFFIIVLFYCAQKY